MTHEKKFEVVTEDAAVLEMRRIMKDLMNLANATNGNARVGDVVLEAQGLLYDFLKGNG